MMPSAQGSRLALGGSDRTSLRALLTRDRRIQIGRILLVGATVALFSGGLLPLPALFAGVAIGLYPLIKIGAVDLIQDRKIGTEIFITIATVIAMIGREYVAGAILLTIILIAEFIADFNTERARASIKALIGSVPQTALVRRGVAEERVPVEDLRPGDLVIVRAGERIPVDGVVQRGEASVDQAPITGESVPQEKVPGAPVFAGTVVQLGAIDVETKTVGADTVFARIVALVETAEEQKAPVQKLADRVAAWLIPVVLVFLAVVYIVTRDLRMIITLLVFTSPAELGLATPLVIIAAIARAARSGILVKGGIYLEELAKVDLIAFDKTGTLTLGRPEIVSIETVPSIEERAFLRMAAAAERRSSHPLAQAIVARAKELDIEVPEPAEFEVMPGRGVRALVEGQIVLAGKADFLAESGVANPHVGASEGNTLVAVAAAGRFLGSIRIADQVRPGARDAITNLKRHGIRRVVMLTGDHAAIGERIGRELGVDEVRADLLPEDKVAAIKELQAQGYKVGMVGDGINDAPALAAADVGIAMGAAGSQAAIEAADVALMTDDIAKIGEARAIARRAYRTIKENLIVGVGVVHVAGITAALLRLIGPIQAAVIHLGPDVLVFVNSIKLLRVRIRD